MILLDLINMSFEKQIKHSGVFEDVITVRHSNFDDFCGKLWTTFDTFLDEYFKSCRMLDFCHDKFAYNNKNVLRGIHGDFKTWKLVSVFFFLERAFDFYVDVVGLFFG